MQIHQLHHVQLAMPVGRENEARDFYQGVLGIPEVVKPSHLAARGGCWFATHEQVARWCLENAETAA